MYLVLCVFVSFLELTNYSMVTWIYLQVFVLTLCMHMCIEQRWAKSIHIQKHPGTFTFSVSRFVSGDIFNNSKVSISKSRYFWNVSVSGCFSPGKLFVSICLLTSDLRLKWLLFKQWISQQVKEHNNKSILVNFSWIYGNSTCTYSVNT